MLPLADDVPRRRAPVLTALVITVWITVWITQWLRPDDGNLADSRQAIDCRWGMVPDHLIHGSDTGAASLCTRLNEEHDRFLELLTAQFLHASWWHSVGNVLFLWVFGASVESRLGRVRFLPFIIACGTVALVAEAMTGASGDTPVIGGSGIVAGVLGAYIVLFPRARVWALVVIIPLRLPAWVLLVAWFGYQLVFALGTTDGGIAYWAHVAGFAVGALLIRPASAGLPPPGRPGPTTGPEPVAGVAA